MTDLGTILGRAVDHGCSSVVVDVSGLDHLAPSAPACIAHTARRMAAAAGP